MNSAGLVEHADKTRCVKSSRRGVEIHHEIHQATTVMSQDQSSMPKQRRRKLEMIILDVLIVVCAHIWYAAEAFSTAAHTVRFTGDMRAAPLVAASRSKVRQGVALPNTA